MSSVIDGVVVQSSVSQVESADDTQPGGCMRRWWFDVPQGIRPEQTNQQGDGDVLHGHLARALRGDGVPQGRIKMGKVARATVLRGELPTPGPDLFVEERFSRQPKFKPIPFADGDRPAWEPLDATKTIHLAGVPLEGFIDLAFRRPFDPTPAYAHFRTQARAGEIPTVWDHKSSSSVENLDAFSKPSAGLIKTDQMPVYVESERRRWPDAKLWRLVHYNVCRVGEYAFKREAIVTLDQILERVAHVTRVLERMKVYASSTSQDDVPFNRRACRAWLGCPHQSTCRAFREDQVELSAQELDVFNNIDGKEPDVMGAGIAHAPAAEDPFAGADQLAGKPAAPPAEEDEEAKLERQLAEAKAKKAAAKAKADAEAAAKAEAVKQVAAEKKRIAIADKSTTPDAELRGLTPPPGVKPAEQPWPACECGTQTSPENASRLKDGAVKHIGCPLNAVPPPAPAAPAPAKRAPKAPAIDVAALMAAPLTINIKIDPASLEALRAILKGG